ncbi:MAG: chemotaxis protein CheA [Candidatus Kapaibacteriota bacterium]
MSEKQIDKETQEMLQSFVSEAVDSLDSSEPLVENLKNPEDTESVNAIFRVFHTLKGLSGFFGMMVINEVTHEAETLLDILRKEKFKPNEDLITLIYTAFDLLRDLLHLVANEFSDLSGKDEAENMKLILKDTIQKIKSGEYFNQSSNQDFSEFIVPPEQGVGTSPEDEFMTASSSESAIEIQEELQNPFQVEEKLTAQASTEDLDLGGLISEDMVSQFVSDTLDLLDTIENNLLMLEKEPNDFDTIAAIFGAVHSIKGNSGFMGFDEIQEIAMETETILDSMRKKELEADATIISILLSNIETIRKRVENIGNSEDASSGAPVINQQVKDEQPPVAVKPAKEDLKPTSKIEEKPQEIKPQEKVVSAPKIVKEETKQDAVAAVSKNFQQQQKQDMRVETSKIDKLFDLVGELITIETMVTKNPDLAGMTLPSFAKAANQLNKITRELQEVTMSVRMMPLEGLFNKMKRLVRDVSIKLGKKIDFSISGQETEMDKNVIDEISDPLVHILRNSLDHGIEDTDERINAGKPEVGKISLSARYEGNEILISVKDDGAGINKEKVLKKAEEKGLLTMPPEKMTDKEIFALLFEPGFSTAKQVTDISGRGVGMDVVRKNIEKLRGAIDVESEYGKGTTVTLRIPLTLAIMEALLVKVGDDTYALPIMNVNETFRVSNEEISKTMDGLEMIKIRNEVLPVFRIHELFKRKPKHYDLDKGIILIIESRSKKFCLFADELIGQQQAVIKGLSDYIGKIPGITGCMVLGDSSIGLILDIEGTLQIAENPQYFNNQNLILV